jgi:hypothetical protein
MIRGAHGTFGIVHGVGIGYIEVRVVMLGLDPGVVVVHGHHKMSVEVLAKSKI